VVGIVVNFDEQAIGAGGHRRAGHRTDFVAASGTVRRIGENWKMRKFLDDGDGGDIQRVAKVRIKVRMPRSQRMTS